jgi:hypothetical protein
MKNGFVVLLLLLFTTAVVAQKSLIVEGVNINETGAEYVEATLLNLKLLKPRDLVCYVDWGAKEEKGRNYRIEEDGEDLLFKSRTTLYNYFYERGWEYVETYKQIIPKVGEYDRHVFKRRDD